MTELPATLFSSTEIAEVKRRTLAGESRRSMANALRRSDSTLLRMQEIAGVATLAHDRQARPVLRYAKGRTQRFATCQWIDGNPDAKHPDAAKCGAATTRNEAGEIDSPFCPAHRARAYRKAYKWERDAVK